jgi:hypothetical protein
MQPAITLDIYNGADAVNRLPDIDLIIRKESGEDNTSCLRDLGSVLGRHGKQDKFGIFLLHKHFDLLPNELLFEEISEDGRISVVQPVAVDDSRVAGAEQTGWAVNQKNPGILRLDAIQWNGARPAGKHDTRINADDVACLYELSGVLLSHHKQKRFGFCLTDRLTPREDELVLERNDPLRRVSVTTPVPRTDELERNSIQTAWIFNKEGVGGAWCHKHCEKHPEYNFHQQVHEAYGG